MPRSVRTALAALAAILAFGALPAIAADLGRPEIERRAEAAARYLVATETVEGRFFYEFDFLRSRFTNDDNIVRQTGAGFVLNQFYFFSGKPDFAEPAARTILYYEAKSVPVGDGSMPSGTGTAAGARSGAGALALLAELFHSRALGADFRPDLRAAWLKGLAARQLDNGGIAQTDGAASEDSYATGETWLALAHYVDLVPNDPLAAAMLGRLEAGMMPKYLETPDLMFAHWGLMAAAQRLGTTGQPRYRDFIVRFAGNYLRNLMPADDAGFNQCAGLEGLIAAAAALAPPGDAELAVELVDRIDADLPRYLALQLSGDSSRLEFGPDHFYEDPKLRTFAGAFLNGAYALRTRVDSTQHCLSALLLYRQLAEGETGWKL